MLIRLLGQVELTSDDVSVRLPTSAAAGALTALALEVGATVRHDRLCGMLWDSLPSSAIHNLRGHIAEIRRYLRLAMPGSQNSQRAQIVTLRACRGGWGGYRLRAHQGDIDVHVFSKQADLAQRAIRIGDWAGAYNALSAGMTLWRGPAGMGIAASDRLRGRLDGFTLRHLDLREDLTETLIQLGHFQQASQFAQQMTADHPLRERPWGQLIRTRYLLGDLDGAHISYDRARRTLSEELGHDPSPRLQQLHVAVIHRDEAVLFAER
jgi:DNA-binding SARP family transcriptional activator